MRKRILLFRLSTLSLLTACALNQQDNWLNDIEGTYAMQYQQPYSYGWDTLVIQRLGTAGSNHFTIQRHTKYQRLINGQKGTPVLKITTRQVDADDANTSLIQTATGRHYDFNPVKKEIRTGNVTYYKLK